MLPLEQRALPNFDHGGATLFQSHNNPRSISYVTIVSVSSIFLIIEQH